MEKEKISESKSVRKKVYEGVDNINDYLKKKIVNINDSKGKELGWEKEGG